MDAIRSEKGSAVLVALMAVLLTSALGAALILTSSSETMVARNFQSSREALYAADAIAEHAMGEMLNLPDWNQVLDGSVHSAFVDGAPSGTRTLPDAVVDLSNVVSMANCLKATACTDAEMDATTDDRPWGANNPRWRPFAHGYLRDMLPAGAIDSPFYVVLMVGDDPSETDNDPTRDGDDVANPGAGVIAMRAEAYGPRAAHKAIEITMARTPPFAAEENESPGPGSGPTSYNNGVGQPVVRILSWREVR